MKYPRIGLYGNIANNFYVIGKALRSNSDIDVHLYLEGDTDLVQSPESEDPEIKDNYPGWIHKSADWNITNSLSFWRHNIVKELSQYDIVILSGRGASLAPFLKTRTIFFVTGGDLTLIPFYQRFVRLYRKESNIFKAIIGKYLQRRGIRRFSEIWTQPFSPFVNALKSLKVSNDKIKNIYFPVMVNTKLFRFDQTAAGSDDKNIRRICDNFKFVIFHPSRLMIDPHPELKKAGQWKQNDLLFYAFADFIHKSGTRDAVLVMPDRTVSHDIMRAKEIINELKIVDNVVWIKANHPEGFTRKELVKFYSIADAVADDFGVGWFGSVVLEGFAVGKPVISYVDEEVMKKLYAWHPFLSSNTREGLAEIILRLYQDSSFKNSQGVLGRKWIEEFHSPESASKIYVNQFLKTLRYPVDNSRA
jgi:glycosyltransferase involved in cell wall biosynthesis